jgi:hypothetical protein
MKPLAYLTSSSTNLNDQVAGPSLADLEHSLRYVLTTIFRQAGTLLEQSGLTVKQLRTGAHGIGWGDSNVFLGVSQIQLFTLLEAVHL